MRLLTIKIFSEKNLKLLTLSINNPSKQIFNRFLNNFQIKSKLNLTIIASLAPRYNTIFNQGPEGPFRVLEKAGR